MEKREKRVLHLWTVSDSGEMEAISRLCEIYQSLKMVGKDKKASMRQLEIAAEGVDFWRSNEFEWGTNQRRNDSLRQEREY